MVEILDRKTSFVKEGIIFSYEGKPSHKMIDFILEISESKLRLIEKRSAIVKRIVNILIEVLQNIFNHGENYKLVHGHGFKYALYTYEEDYYISTENFIKNKKVAGFEDKLKNYLSINHADLADLYRKTLHLGKFTAKGGAGLGLIHILRKSGGNLDYKFTRIDEKYSLFQLRVKIKAK